MTIITATFGYHVETVNVPDVYIEDTVEDFFTRGAIAVTTNSDALV